MKILVFIFTLLCSTAYSQTLEEVKAYIESKNLEHKDVVFGQVILETGWLKCTKCSLDNNNLFGFLYKGKYLYFSDWKKSVDYYVWWQKQLYKGGDYYDFLDRIGYATAKDYIPTLKIIVNQNGEQQDNS